MKKGSVIKCMALLASVMTVLQSPVFSDETCETINKKIIIDENGGNIYSGGTLRLPRTYCQDNKDRVVIDASGPFDFARQNEKDPSEIFCDAGDRYVQYLNRGWYKFHLDKPGNYVVWHKAWFPSIGHWCHTESINNGEGCIVSDNNSTDPNDPVLKRWVWKKGREYNLKKGENTISLDWQGGTRLSIIAILPKDMDPEKEETLTPTFNPEMPSKETSFTKPVTLSNGEELKSINIKSSSAGGGISMEYSADKGKTWHGIPENGIFPKPLNSQTPNLLFSITLSESSSKSSPTVYDISAVIAAKGGKASRTIPGKMVWQGGDIGLVPTDWKGLRYSNGMWNLVKASMPDNNGTVWLDSSNADNLIIAPKENSWIMEQQDACAGKALYQGIFNRNLISFDFYVPGKSKYCVWFRVKLFRKGIALRAPEMPECSMRYKPDVVYQFDGQKTIRIDYTSKNDFPLKYFAECQWIWVPGDISEINEGYHVFRLRSGFDCCILDRIALVKEGAPAPEGKGGISHNETAISGEMIFQKIACGKLLEIGIPACNGKAGSANVSYEYCENSGKTWKPFDNKLAFIPGKSQTVQIKAVIKKDASHSENGGIKNWTLTVVPRGKDIIALSNQEQEILFDAASGFLMGWNTKSAGWIIPFGHEQNIFSLSYSSPTRRESIKTEPEKNDLQNIKVEKVNNSTTLTLDYGLWGGEIKAAVELKMPEKGLPSWGIDIKNDSKMDLSNIEFPTFSGLRIGDDAEGNYSVVLLPSHATADFPGAPYQITNAGKSFVGPGFGTSGVYPGWYSMGWLSLYTGKLGSFTGQLRDNDGIGTYISLVNEKSPFVKTGFKKKIMIEPGKSAGMNYAAGWHEGDWHRSADYYSEWAHSVMDFSRVNSNWARNADGWLCSWDWVSSSMASRYMTHLVPEMEWIGASYFQHFTGEVATTFPLINPKFGSPEDFRNAHSQSSKKGFYHSYYWTCKGWFNDFGKMNNIDGCPKSLLPEKITIPPVEFGLGNVIKDESGNSLAWGYHPIGDMILDPANDEWRNYIINGMVKNYSQLEGATGVYSDEASGYMDCFNTAHSHGKQFGFFAKGLARTYADAIDAARKKDPNFFLTIEGSPDYLLQFADFGLWGMSEYADGSPLLYAFPEAKLLRGNSNPGGGYIRSPEEYVRFVALFLRLDDVSHAANIKKFYSQRKMTKDWMYMKKFMDDINLRVSKAGITAKWFKTDEPFRKGALINIQNEFEIGDAEITLTDPIIEKASNAYAYLMEEEEVRKIELKKDGGAISFKAPKAKFAGILIPSEAPERESLRIHALWPRKKGEDKLDVYLLNLSGKSMRLNLNYSVPDGIILEKAPANALVGAGDICRISIPMRGVQSLKKLSAITVKADDASGTLAANDSCLLAPSIRNGGFETDSAGKGTPDGWRTIGHNWFTHLAYNPKITQDFLNHADGIMDSSNPAEGRYSLRLDGKLDFPNIWVSRKNPEKAPMKPWYFNTGHRLILKPETSYRLSLKYRTEKDGGSIKIQSVPYGELEYASLRKVFPDSVIVPQRENRQWQDYSFDFKMPPDVSETYLTIVNMSASPVWIDVVKIEETN